MKYILISTEELLKLNINLMQVSYIVIFHKFTGVCGMSYIFKRLSCILA